MAYSPASGTVLAAPPESPDSGITPADQAAFDALVQDLQRAPIVTGADLSLVSTWRRSVEHRMDDGISW